MEMGLDLDIAFCVEAMRSMASELGLAGTQVAGGRRENAEGAQ